MSTDSGFTLRRLSPRRSIAGKTYFLMGLGLLACGFLLVVSLATMEVAKACNTMLKGERDHTVHLYGAFHDFQHFVQSGDEASWAAFEVDLDVALGLSGTFGSSIAALETQPLEELAEALAGYGPSVSYAEARQLFRVVDFLSGNTRVVGLVGTAAQVNRMVGEYRTLADEYRAGGTEAELGAVTARMDELTPRIEEEVLSFNRGATELNEWAGGLANLLLWTVFVAVLLGGGFLAWRIVGSMDRSLQMVVEFSDRLSQGDFSQRLPTGARDETGVMARTMNHLCDNLQGMMGRIAEGSTTLASSLSQISSTASELAATSSESSTAVSEISTTLEEIRQTSHLSSERAGEVADQAEAMTSVAVSGEDSVEEIVAGMRHIKDEMEYIAESILHLSEKNKRVETIIDAVTDLADQSNLLSVNASIEAAKAGEQGKGFGVVAREMRVLADQSKEATHQIKGILDDIQSATGAAVMATERGSKAVDQGVDLSSQAGESIKVLAMNVTESADSATQIAASVQQQLLGLDELVEAMASIKDASVQNLDGARQLESASRDLAVLGQDLADLSARFKV